MLIQGLSPRDIAIHSGNQRILNLFRRDFGYKRFVSHTPPGVSTGESNEQVLSTLFVSHSSFVSYMGVVITVYDDYLEWTESQTATRLQAIFFYDRVALLFSLVIAVFI